METSAETKNNVGTESTELQEFDIATALTGIEGNPPSLAKEKEIKAKEETEKAKKAEEAKEEDTSKGAEQGNSTGDEVEVEEYEQDEEGNLLKDGKVVAKKGEYTVNDEGEITFSTTGKGDNLDDVVTLAKEKGFNFLDENNEPVTFENTNEGVFDFATNVGKQMVQNFNDELLRRYPVVQDIVNHIDSGQPLDKFFELRSGNTDYTGVKLNTDDVAQHRQIVKDYLTKVGSNSPDDAEEMIGLWEDAGKLAEKAKTALKGLVDHQTATLEQQRAETAKLAAESKAKAQQYWKGVKNIVSEGNLKLSDTQSFAIPDKEKNDFFNFLYAKDKDGNTRSDKAFAQLTTEQQLLQEYFLYKGLNIADLVAMQVRKEKVKNLRQRKAVLKQVKGSGKVQKSGDYNTEDYGLGNLT